MRSSTVLLAALLAACCPVQEAPPCGDTDLRAAPEQRVAGNLEFVSGDLTRTLSIQDLIGAVGPESIEVEDPYYKKKKRFRALPLTRVLERGFEKNAAELVQLHFVLEAKDGYTTPVSGERLIAPVVYLAFADLEHEQLQPIGPRGADPRPLYMVWSGQGHGDTDVYPHPWALSRIVATPAQATLERTRPAAGFGSNEGARLGYSIFERRCLHCHSINQQGGKLGPELNVPRNILSYRSEANVRAFIKDPQSFRYSSMLPNPDLTEDDLDGIVAYLRLMADHPLHTPSP